jgi:hypothetical protein
MKVMVLGADGLCGTALVPMIESLFEGVETILIDPSEESGPKIIRAEVKEPDLWHVLKSFGMGEGDALIDLTPNLSKIDVMQSADTVGVSCINATACEFEKGALSVVDLLDDRLLLARYKWRVPHIIGAGMNPGNINALLGMMVEKAGRPIDVTEWEMDSTIPFEWDGEGFATWSPAEFASEFSDESTWEIEGRKILFADGPPIGNLLTMPDGSSGALCQHEELVKWGWTHNCKARYLYGYMPEAMKAIARNIESGLELPLCRKLEGRVPTGGDFIALKAEFDGGIMTGSVSIKNDDTAIPNGSNATSYLVACGIVAGLEMLRDESNPGLNWPDDYGSRWIKFLADNQLCNVQLSGLK